VNSVVRELETPQGGLMSVAVALAVWSASAAVLGTMNALNVVFEVKERRPLVKRIVVSLVYTIALAMMLVIAAGMMVSGPDVLTWLSRYVGLDNLFVLAWMIVRWPLAVFLLLLAIALVYWSAPNAKVPFRLITPGAVLAVTAWIGASLAFGFYVANFASYNKTYGSMGAVVVLLLYFFISAAVMLLGAELNAVLARDRGERVEQATQGRGSSGG
jgi:membrane protein